MEANKLISAQQCEVDWFPGVKRARANHSEKDPRPFEQKRICLPKKTRMARADLEWLLSECGAEIVKSADDADYGNASEEWLLSCVENFALMPREDDDGADNGADADDGARPDVDADDE